MSPFFERTVHKCLKTEDLRKIFKITWVNKFSVRCYIIRNFVTHRAFTSYCSGDEI